MLLSCLLKNLEDYQAFGETEIEVSGISDDSRKVKPGDLFVAIKGENFDSHDFITQAFKNGAKAIVGEKEPSSDLKGTYIKVKNSRKALSLLASTWYGNPSQGLKLIGVTGTDGKTTTANIIYQILKSAGKNVGLISTVNAKIGEKEIETGLHVTNPEPLLLEKLLKEMVDQNCEYVVLEVTSHGIDQERIAGLKFEVSVLTNITSEHLDYHKTFENYLNTKAKLFLNSKISILNKKDQSFEKISEILKDQKIITYPERVDADLDEVVKNRFPQDYNQANAQAAIAVCSTLEISKESIKEGIKVFSGISGRMEEISNNKGLKIIVDFAHTPNALENVLSTLKRELPEDKKLIAVFGCAGERDPHKRFEMGKIAAKIADFSIFTAEDPRIEDLFAILEEMKKGALEEGTQEVLFGLEQENIKKEGKHSFALVPERQEAIAFALNKIASSGDIVVFTGKGHEKSLAYGKIEHPWSDQEMIKNVLEARKDLGVIVLAAGMGKRMNSPFPKVLHKIAGRAMISYTLENLRKAKLNNIIVVVGFQKEEVIKEIQGSITFSYQPALLGTADAAARGLEKIAEEIKTVVVLNGDDSAFYSPETINKVISLHEKSLNKITFVSLHKENPFGLGRVVRDENGNLEGIVEEKDATDEERKIKEINDGLYIFEKDWLKENLPQIKKSPQGEYYLVDLVKIALEEKLKVDVFKLEDSNEWQGINTQEQLQEAEDKMQKKLQKWN